MEEKSQLRGLESSYLIKCRGVSKKEIWPLSEEAAEQVIVKVYRDGHTIPVCRYLEGDSDDICSAALDEEDRTFCPYRTFR